MRRDRKLHPEQQKAIARIEYANRQLDKFIKWSIQSKGYLKYKDLIKYSKKYGTSDSKYL